LGSDRADSRLISASTNNSDGYNPGRWVVNQGFWLLSIVACLLYVGLVRDIDREVRDL
jgi:hypothetical protein